MKIISNKKYNEWKELELKFAALETGNELLKNNVEELLNEIEIKDNTYNNLKKEMDNLLNINKELGDKLEIEKKETKRLKTLLTKNKILYRKENK